MPIEGHWSINKYGLWNMGERLRWFEETHRETQTAKEEIKKAQAEAKNAPPPEIDDSGQPDDSDEAKEL